LLVFSDPGKAQLDGASSSSDQLVFFIVIGAGFVRKGECGIVDSRYQHFLLVEEHIAGSNSKTSSDAQAGIRLEREVEKEVKIRAPAEAAGMNTVRLAGPCIVTELKHEMIVRSPGQIKLAPVLLTAAGFVLAGVALTNGFFYGGGRVLF